MNILIIDTDNVILNTFNLIKKIEPNWNIQISDGTLNTYNNNIDFVIVDFSIQSNQNLLNEIIKINQKQKTITISGSLSCSEIKGCQFCILQYNRRRLLKPINLESLHELINHFGEDNCGYANTNSFHDIELILPNILKRFLSYSYNQNSKTLHHTSNSSSIHTTKDMVDIIEILKTHNLKYNIINDTDIEIIYDC